MFTLPCPEISSVHLMNHSARLSEMPSWWVQCSSSNPTKVTRSPPAVFGQESGTPHSAQTTKKAKRAGKIVRCQQVSRVRRVSCCVLTQSADRRGDPRPVVSQKSPHRVDEDWASWLHLAPQVFPIARCDWNLSVSL